MPNRLSRETSPYLRQHQDNPVDWYPWGPEALERARREKKPILLSVGYSACHWCHVMAHESFENPEIARQMNEQFINIKVDREERPDLDQIYQKVAQLITRSGGWPLTVFLTPDLRPYYGGTYFPPEDRYGRPGFPKVLSALSEAFQNDPDSVSDNAQKLMDAMQAFEKVDPADGERELPTLSRLTENLDRLLGIVDWQNGGVGGAPKFPNAMALTYLWRMGSALDHEQARDAVLLSLKKMTEGGIYDQLGGGFHRYAVDATWSVPHFEKMLYDNGLLLKLYSEVLLEPGALDAEPELREQFLWTVQETVEYVLREMTSPEGLFYAAQDADSEGEEGKFFVWDLADLAQVLTPNEARAFAARYGVREGGNFEHGKTVLHAARAVSEIEPEFPEGDLQELLTFARMKLLKARQKRVAPGLDDKVLASWNGLMISGLAWASQALRMAGREGAAERALTAATRAFDSVCARFSRDGDRLLSVYKDGQARLNGHLDDYAFLAMAALDLSRFSALNPEPRLAQARRWTQTILKHFSDPSGAGFFFTSDDHESLIHRPKGVFDQAIPSGTAVALQVMIALGELGERFREVERALGMLSTAVRENPFGLAEMASAELLYFSGPVTVSGPHSRWLCRSAQLFQKVSDKTESGTVVCHRQTCSLPLAKDQAFAEVLKLRRK